MPCLTSQCQSGVSIECHLLHAQLMRCYPGKKDANIYTSALFRANCDSFMCTLSDVILLTQEDAIQHIDIRLDRRSVHRKPTSAVSFLKGITVLVQAPQCKHVTWIMLHNHMRNIMLLGNQNRALIIRHTYEVPWSIADKTLRFSSLTVSKVLHERMCETKKYLCLK